MMNKGDWGGAEERDGWGPWTPRAEGRRRTGLQQVFRNTRTTGLAEKANRWFHPNPSPGEGRPGPHVVRKGELAATGKRQPGDSEEASDKHLAPRKSRKTAAGPS